MKLFRVSLVPTVVVALGCFAVLAGAAPQTQPQRIEIQSPTLRAGQPVPIEHTADGPNTSPALTWSNVPAGAKELVVAVEDQDADTKVPSLIPLLHWVVYRIPPAAKGLAAAFPPQEVINAPQELFGACQAYTVFDTPGYRGPQPYPGELHHYRFSVYALDAQLNLEPGLGANEVLRAIKGHIIGQGDMIVTFERKPRPKA